MVNENENLGLERIFDKVNPIWVEHWRDGELLSKELTHNGIVTEGKNSILNVMFRATTQLTTWYFGLINNSGFTALADADTMSSHGGWAEAAGYSETTRQQWLPDAAASGAVTNSTAATFNINATATLYGLFLASNSTKSGTTGVLWATAAFASTKSVVSGDQIKLTYNLSC
jgi:hypothetical protein